MYRATHMLSWVVASLLTLPIQIECRGFQSLRERNRLVMGSLKEAIDDPNISLRMMLQFQACVDELNASDLDGDKLVSKEEYVSFISTRSRGGIDVDEFNSLPFSLISNFIYGSCFCSVVSGGDPNCCVGENAGIGLDVEQYPVIKNNLVTICRNTDASIGDLIGTLPPTTPPTGQPTVTPVTDAPTGTPVTDPPTGTPVTDAPTGAPVTDAPTGTPVTDTPTGTPTGTPTATPTAVPTATPTSSPTDAPTLTPTATPTATPTSTPTDELTTAPVAPTPEPLPEGLLCLDFQYGIENDEDVTADDIELGVNNTIKSDLINATREIVIEILNGTIPEGRLLRRDTVDLAPRWKTIEGQQLMGVVKLEGFDLELNTQDRRRAAYLPDTHTDSNNNNRRLAFYTDSFPPEISNVIDNPFCNASNDDEEEVSCSIVESTVCVILEEGDEEEEVKEEIFSGIQDAFADGRFEDTLA